MTQRPTPVSMRLGEVSVDPNAGDASKTRDQLVAELRALRLAASGAIALFDQAPDPTLICDARHRIAKTSASLLVWLGYPRPEALVGQPVAMLVPEDDRAALANFLHTVGEQQGPALSVESRFVHYDGRKVMGQVSAANVKTTAGESLLITIRDMNMSPSTHARLRTLEAAVDHMQDIVFITEAEARDNVGRRIVFVNRAFTQVTGYQADEVIGKTPNVTIGELTDRTVLQRIEASLRERRPVHEELQKYRKDGSSYWVQIDIIPVWDASGRHTHWVSVQRDVTERRALQSRFRGE